MLDGLKSTFRGRRQRSERLLFQVQISWQAPRFGLGGGLWWLYVALILWRRFHGRCRSCESRCADLATGATPWMLEMQISWQAKRFVIRGRRSAL